MELNRKNIIKIAGLIVFGIFMFWLFDNFEQAKAAVSWLISLVTPLLIGACIAFILNVPMRAIERKLWPNASKTTAIKLRRPCAIVLALLCFAVVLALVLTLIIPELVNTARSFAAQSKSFLDRIDVHIEELRALLPQVNGESVLPAIDIEGALSSVLSGLSDSVTLVASGLVTFVIRLFGGAFDAVFGIAFSFYLLAQKDNLARQIKHTFIAFNQEKLLERLLRIGRLSDKTFSHFLSGQCVEAVILGTLFFISMSLFRMPYALLISVLISVTALIPIVGAFIGCIVGALLILVESPIMAIWFVIWFLVLQQLEGNLIYPHVVGTAVSLPGLWVLFAVTVGGAVGGVLGMFIGVPLVSVLYTLAREEVWKRLRQKKEAAKE